MIVVSLLVACSGTSTETVEPPPAPAPPGAARVVARPPDPVPFSLSTEPIPGFPDLRTGTTQHLQLHLLPAKVEVGPTQLPPKVMAVTDEFVLEHEEVPNPRGAKREMVVLRALLPFPVESDEQDFRPEGMDVSIEGKPVPFGRGPAPQAKRPTWRVNGKSLVLTWPTVPPEGTVKVRYEGVKAALDRHDLSRAGLPAEQFVRYDMTLERETRHGLTLPAPSSAEWDLKLPEGAATFEGWLALEPSPLDRPRSDGAAIQLSVVSDGRETVVSRQELDGPSKAYTQWRVDLSAYAGKDVTLRLVTDPLKTPTFDWVFVGSPSIWGPPKGDVRRVVVVALDTTRPDHLSMSGYRRPTTPELDAWASTGVVMTHTWSTAPRTRPSFRSATTGRLPLEAVGARNIAAVFNEKGFATAGLVANVHLQPRFDFDEGFDWWLFDGRADAADQVDRALAWLGDNQQRDTYLFVHFMDPHMAYEAPGEFRDRFVEDPDPTLPKKVRRSDVLGWMKTGQIDARRKAHLEALHDGELAYTSHELGRLFDTLDRMPGRTLVVLHSDHGEEFWEHDGFEHNHSLYDELTRTALVLRPRGGLPEGKRLETPASLMDIGPTLYDLFGFGDAPPVDGRTLVPALIGAPMPDRAIPIGYLQYSHERWGVVWNEHKYILHTGTGKEELYDLKADPGEHADLSAKMDLEPYRARLREAHGVPVGPGWRVHLSLEANGQPLTLELPAPARAADVLDPEAIVEHRANIEWGELPRRLSRDVGRVDLSEDGRTLTFHPGVAPEGLVYVLFDQPVALDGTVARLGAQQLEFQPSKRGFPVWKDGAREVGISPGTVVIPPPTEADRMGIGPSAAGAEQEMSLLCELGYVTCEEGDEPVSDDEPHGDPHDEG